MGPLHLPVSDPPQADISKKAFHKTLFIFLYFSYRNRGGAPDQRQGLQHHLREDDN